MSSNNTFRIVLLTLITVVCIVLVIHNPAKYFWTIPIALVASTVAVFSLLAGGSSQAGLSEAEVQAEMDALRDKLKPSSHEDKDHLHS